MTTSEKIGRAAFTCPPGCRSELIARMIRARRLRGDAAKRCMESAMAALVEMENPDNAALWYLEHGRVKTVRISATRDASGKVHIHTGWKEPDFNARLRAVREGWKNDLKQFQGGGSYAQ
jgi:hypothetical protein